MNKKKKIDILDKLIEGNIEQKDLKLVRFRLFILQIICFIIVLFLLTVNFLNVWRSIVFSYLVFKTTALIPCVLYVSLLLAFLYTSMIIIFYSLSYKDENLLRKLAKIYKKFDLIRFIDLILF